MRGVVQILLVATGSALGGLTRWGVSLAASRYFGSAFPWGTFLINITGSLFLSWFATVARDKLLPADSWLRPDDLYLLVAVGFTGTYTTFSTFEYEADKMLWEGNCLLGWTYLFASVFFGLAAVRLGVGLARWR